MLRVMQTTRNYLCDESCCKHLPEITFVSDKLCREHTFQVRYNWQLCIFCSQQESLCHWIQPMNKNAWSSQLATSITIQDAATNTCEPGSMMLAFFSHFDTRARCNLPPYAYRVLQAVARGSEFESMIHLTHRTEHFGARVIVDESSVDRDRSFTNSNAFRIVEQHHTLYT